MLHVSPSEVHFWPITQHVLPCWQHGLYCSPVRKGLAQPSHVVQGCFCRLLFFWVFFSFYKEFKYVCLLQVLCEVDSKESLEGGSGVMLICSISLPFDVCFVFFFFKRTSICTSVSFSNSSRWLCQRRNRQGWWFCQSKELLVVWMWLISVAKCCDGYLSLFGVAAMDV